MTEPDPYALTNVMGGTPPAPRRRRKPLIAAGIAVTALVGVSIYLAARPDLAEDDPAGARACQMLAAWQRGDISDDRATMSAALGEQAARAATKSIRAAAGTNVMDDPALNGLSQRSGVTSLRFANIRQLHAACEDEGVDMPPFVQTD